MNKINLFALMSLKCLASASGGDGWGKLELQSVIDVSEGSALRKEYGAQILERGGRGVVAKYYYTYYNFN